MMKIVLTAFTVMGAANCLMQSGSIAADLGQAIGLANLGSCLAFQDDQTDTTTTCFVSCNVTSNKIASAFNSSQYTDGIYNSGEMMTQLQNAGIQLMTQFKDCRTTEFLFSLDNRLSNSAFLTGTVANLATQVGTLVGYHFGGLETLKKQHAMYKLYESI